ncbi:Retrovirus-related Pol poly from transposon [Labeo rohita]|uniref:ribonuclease H n=1 Tax=Labeo rohita TaxID=84645 RepID=A0A498NYD8_LABRO|nr:Retrovirus-related Pol poly from transposon [Labeo rohita]
MLNPQRETGTDLNSCTVLGSDLDLREIKVLKAAPLNFSTTVSMEAPKSSEGHSNATCQPRAKKETTTGKSEFQRKDKPLRSQKLSYIGQVTSIYRQLPESTDTKYTWSNMQFMRYSHANEICKSRQRGRKPRRTFCDLSSDSGEECSDHRERIPTLRPDQFDGSTSWREFLNRFEDCAKANHWSERTMTVQMRFCLVGAAGAVIHKNPRSSRWDYARIVEEVEAAYSPSSKHAAAIGIELRQRVRRAGEPLHVLRDDISEKVSIAYADRSEKEQDSISVEIFTNAMGDADIMQRLLEERPRTLARAYEITHRYETTRRTATSIPYFNPKNKPWVHVVRTARTAILEAGREYIVPGNAHFREEVQGNMLLSPTKGFMEKHQVMVARIIIGAQPSHRVPVRLYNPGTVAVKVRKGVIAGILQPADVVQASTAELPPVDSCPTVVPSHLPLLYAESTGDLREAEQHELAELLCAYSDVFSTGPTDLGRTYLVQHDIQTQPGPPVKQQPCRMAFEKQQSADEQIQQNLNACLASPSNSCWASPIVMVRKKDQTYRLCVDYRALNERTIKDAYPLPRIQDTLDTLSTAKWFSTLDLASGYWQVELTPQARQAAAFCSRKGLFAWNVMPFGLCNAPATFQRLMDRVLAGMQWEICLVYLDDIVVLCKDVKEMLQRLAQVFERLRQANLKLKPAKCCLFRRQVVYLGQIVSEHGIATDPEKVQKIWEWPEPMSINEVRQFVGLASYYRRFV